MFTVTCENATESATTFSCYATQSATLQADIVDTSGMQGIAMLIWWGFGLLILMQAVKTGLIWFRG